MSSLKAGDVLAIVQGGWGFLPDDEGKVVKLLAQDSYFEWEVEAYDCTLKTEDLYGITETSFGENPVVLLNVFDKPELELNIQRPILEERKVGKVKMHLYDEAFPNAILEIAKVMGWAEENKGYKPNDFKNLPNAETEFSAAASRHRVKGFIQKAQGVPAIERTDEESNIVHLAHTAFNVLAELELVLTGKIK